MERKQENIDTSEGMMNPVNSHHQGECFEEFKDLINIRLDRLIKKVNYKIEIEYYPKEES